MTNLPYNTAGILKVEKSGYASDNYIRQIYKLFDTADAVYARSTVNGGSSWTDWVKEPTRAEINNKLDKMASAVDVIYGESGASIDIDTISSQAYIIRINYSGADFSGTAPSGLSGNGAILFGFSIPGYGCQIAFGFGSNKIAIRNKPFNGTWQDWRYI